MFAIVITLLILPISMDVGIDATGDLSLGEVLQDLTPPARGVRRQLVIGQFRLAHLRNFDLISRTDRALTSPNLLELMVICFRPFPTRYSAHAARMPEPWRSMPRA